MNRLPKTGQKLLDYINNGGGFYVVRSSEGKGLPARLKNLTLDQIRKIVVTDWKRKDVERVEAAND
jgi:hypothetical protein